MPPTTFATALRDLGASGRAVLAMRDRAVLPAMAAYEAALAPTATARALADFSAEIGRVASATLIRKDLP